MASDAEVVKVRRAAGLSSRSEAETLLSELNADELSTALALADRWVAIDDKFFRIDGEVKLDPQDKRNAIRHELRNLFGLPVYGEEEQGAGFFESCAVPVEAW